MCGNNPHACLQKLCTHCNTVMRPSFMQDYVSARFRSIPGVNLAEPQGAFYVLPEMSAFFGPGAQAQGFGPVPDSDTFCRYLIEKANVSGWWCYCNCCSNPKCSSTTLPAAFIPGHCTFKPCMYVYTCLCSSLLSGHIFGMHVPSCLPALATGGGGAWRCIWSA